MVFAVLARDAGHIALHAAIAGGAAVCLIPEVPYSYEGVIDKLNQLHEQGCPHALIVVAEGVKTRCGQNVKNAHGGSEVRYGGIGHYLSTKIIEDTNYEARVTVLGHVQRGGVAEGRNDRMVVWRAGKVEDVSLDDVVDIGTALVSPDSAVLKAARGLGIYVGE